MIELIATMINAWLLINTAGRQADMFSKNILINHFQEALYWTLQISIVTVCAWLLSWLILFRPEPPLLLPTLLAQFGFRWLVFDFVLNIIRGKAKFYSAPGPGGSILDHATSALESVFDGFSAIVKGALTILLYWLGTLLQF